MPFIYIFNNQQDTNKFSSCRDDISDGFSTPDDISSASAI